MLAAEPAGQLAFVAGTEQEDRRVELVDLTTGVLTPVGPGARDGAPAWSPDGQWLAFPSAQPGGMGIRVVRADGTESRELPHTHSWNDLPRWSPDSKLLAYTGARDTAGIGPESLAAMASVMVYSLDTNTEELWGEETMSLFRPVWMNAGSVIAIGVIPGEKRLTTGIFIVTSAGVNPLPAIAMPSAGQYVEWAAEVNLRENLLAYESNDGGDREIFVLSFKRGSTDVSNHRAADWNPVWQPNGRWLAFESFRSGRRGVYRVLPSTINVIPVAVTEDSDNWHPAWSPDGAFLAYVSTREGTPQVFMTELESGKVRQVTQGARFALAPAWRPAP